MEKNTSKVHTLRDEHRGRLLAMAVLFCSTLFDLLIQVGILNADTVAGHILDIVVSLFMLIAALVWVGSRTRFKAEAEDEMAYENLHKAMNRTFITLVVLFTVLSLLASLLNLSVSITINGNFLVNFFCMLIALFIGLQSLFFLLIERKYMVSDEEE